MNFFEKVALYPTHFKGLLMSDPYRNGEYKFLEKHVAGYDSTSLIFDVGANIGEYSEKILEFNPAVNIQCFEPIPDTFKQLTLRHQGKENVRLNHFALSDEKGVRSMYEYGKLNGTNSLEKHPDLISDKTNRIETTLQTIDDYCEEHSIDTIDYLKIDVEGHEVNVLRGAKKMLQEKKIHSVQIEYNFLWKNTSNTMEDVFELLAENYNIYRLTFWGKIHTKKFTKAVESFPAAANYVAIVK